MIKHGVNYCSENHWDLALDEFSFHPPSKKLQSIFVFLSYIKWRFLLDLSEYVIQSSIEALLEKGGSETIRQPCPLVVCQTSSYRAQPYQFMT